MNLQHKIISYLSEMDNPIFDTMIADEFEIEKNQREIFFDILDNMVTQGKLVRTKKKKYGLPRVFGMIRGRIQSTQKGFAFLIPDDGSLKDVFIPASELNGAMNDDKVLIKIIKKSYLNQRSEGSVVDIVERANHQVVGMYESVQDFGFVLPDNHRINMDIYISKKNNAGAKTGDKVVVKITQWPKGRRNPEGEIIEILGQKGDVGVDILSIIRKYKLPEAFNQKVIARSKQIPNTVSVDDIEGRLDLRDELIFTIDGDDAKDLDDAVQLNILDNGNFQLGVHIADVTHYVKEADVLDKEALKRATSVYLVDRVIPMLPRRLSNGICSLNPHMDRLTLSCIMEIDHNGKIVSHDIVETVINSSRRLTYKQVSDFLENKVEIQNDDVDKVADGKISEYISNEPLETEIKQMLLDMQRLQKILRDKRDKRGSIDFNFAEPKIIVDEIGHPVDIKKADRRIGNRIIEEFMLAANETVAERMYWLELPFVYRNHEQPDEAKIDAFNRFVHNFGFIIKAGQGEIHPKSVQKLLSMVDGRPEEHIISKMMLRSLKQAKYNPVNEGHFGLAANYYCHFTSPIRRYPDLQIHRIIKESLKGALSEGRIKMLEGIVKEVSEQSSYQERVAEKAERETDDLKKCEYMLDFVGETFEGMVSSITSFGIFTELANTVEGMTRLVDLEDDYYYYDEDNMQMVGQRTKKKFRIGDKVLVEVEHVNIDTREIDFLILEKLEDAY